MNSLKQKTIEKFGANIAGIFYTFGNLLQFGLGLLTLSALEVASGFLNISASFLMIFQGHKNWGVRVAYFLGTVAVTMTVWPSLVKCESGTILGYLVFLFTQFLIICSASLTRAFQPADNKLVSNLLGHPR